MKGRDFHHCIRWSLLLLLHSAGGGRGHHRTAAGSLLEREQGPASHEGRRRVMPNPAMRPSLYRTLRVVMSDGSTYRSPSSIRQVGSMLLLDRDPANHPVFLGLSDLSGMVDRREEARLQRIAKRRARFADLDDDAEQL